MKLILISFLLVPSLAVAQVSHGEITGLVTDPAQARVAGATVKATNLATGVAGTASTNSDGNYLLQGLIPGLYRLEVSAPGFKRYDRESVEVHVGDVVSLAVQLDVGDANERITVKAETPLLEAESAGVGQVVDSRRITDLPLPQSNVLSLMYLAPGVASGTASLPTSTWELGSTSVQGNMSMAGARPATNEVTVDGTPAMSGSNIVFTPFQETVQEFRVQTIPFDAAAGRYSGGHVSIVLKSGTNGFHGDASYTNLTRGLIAKDFFINRFIYDPRTGPITQAKIDSVWPPQSQVSYRFDLNGPVRIPKLYNGKDRTFFMYGMLIYRRQGNVLDTDTVPTAAERQGNFSALLAVGAQYQIYDPATGVPSTAGRVARLPFPGNIVPANRISPIAQKLLQYWAPPNSPGTADGTNNLIAADPSRAPNSSHIARLDHAASNNNRLFASGNITPADANSYSPLSNDLGRRLHRDEYALSLGDTQIVSPSLSFGFHYGLNRFLTRDASPNNGFDLTSLGLPASLTAGVSPNFVTIPLVTVNGLTNIGNVAGTFTATTFHTFGAEATYIRGAHQFHFGTEMRLYYSNGVVPGNISPQFDFSGATTAGPFSTSAVAPIAQGMASFLLGQPSGGGVDRQPSFAVLSRYHGLYIQDNWKVTSRLTLNLGLRYDLDVPMTERYDRATRAFDFNAVLPISAAAQAAYAANPIPQIPAGQFAVKGGLQFAGVRGVPRGIWNTDRNNFGPRIGIAWQFLPKTVLRAGYGIFYLPMGDDQTTISQTGFNQRTTLVASSDNGQTFLAGLQNPFPTGILNPPGASLGPLVSLGQSISFMNPDLKAGQFHKISFGFQREFPRRVIIDVGYVGNLGVHMAAGRQLDPTPAQYLSNSLVRDQPVIDFLAATFPNPFAGLSGFQGTTLANATLARSQLLKPIPQFGGVVEAFNNGTSTYHALQSRMEKRFGSGLTLQGSFAWSKWLEALSFLSDATTTPDRAPSAFDRPIVIAASGIYELPFGSRKHWLRSSGLLDRVVGGWSMQTIYQFQSGLPLSFGNVTFVGDVHDIPLSGSDRKVEQWFNVNSGFLRASNQALSGNNRVFPATLNGVRGQGINNWNVSLSKSFRIAEQARVQFRAEAVDLLNHTTFAAPNTTPTSTAFGQISGVVGGTTQRRITLFFKVSW